MPGFVSSISNDEEIVFAKNVDFSGSDNPSNTITTDGQLIIGSTTLNLGGTHINIGNLVSPNGTLTIGYSSPNITLDLAGGSLGIDAIDVDTSTAPGTDPVLPNANGEITVTGNQVAAGTIGANVVRTNSLAANTYTIEIQRSDTAAAADSSLNGVSHYNSAQFTIDANGFVSATGTIPLQFTADSGVATPAGGNLNVFGGDGALTSGSGDTITITSFDPTRMITMKDDFINNFGLTTTGSGEIPWNGAFFFSSSASSNTTDPDHPGLISSGSMTAGGGLTVARIFGRPGSTGSILPGGGEISFNWVINITTLSDGTNRFNIKSGLGLSAEIEVSTLTEGIYFHYSDNVNSGNWTLNTVSASSPTTVNTSIAVTTGWHNLGMVINAAGTLITFIIDGVTAGTINTTIPTVALTNFNALQVTIGTVASGTLLIDLFYLTQKLTNPR